LYCLFLPLDGIWAIVVTSVFPYISHFPDLVVTLEDGGKSWKGFNNGLIPDWTFAALAVKTPYV